MLPHLYLHSCIYGQTEDKSRQWPGKGDVKTNFEHPLHPYIRTDRQKRDVTYCTNLETTLRSYIHIYIAL